MSLTVTPSGQSCGSEVAGLDLSQPLSGDLIGELRATGGYEGHRRELHRVTVY